MASVWLHERGQKSPKKIKGHLSEHAAKELYKRMLREWKGRKIIVFAYEALLYESSEQYRSKRPAGSLFVEFCSPPSAPEKGQPHVAQKGQAQ